MRGVVWGLLRRRGGVGLPFLQMNTKGTVHKLTIIRVRFVGRRDVEVSCKATKRVQAVVRAGSVNSKTRNELAAASLHFPPGMHTWQRTVACTRRNTIPACCSGLVPKAVVHRLF